MRNFYILLLIAFTTLSFSQEVTISLDCYQDFKFQYNLVKEFEKSPKETTAFIIAKNNFQELSQPSLQIEVQPMNDCMSDLAGIEYGEVVKVRYNTEKKCFEVKFTEIQRKCFKWRLISTSSNCVAKSDWNFVIFSL